MLSRLFRWIEPLRSRRARRPKKARPGFDTLETRELLSANIPINGLNWTALGPTTSVTNRFNGFFFGSQGPGNTASEITSIVPDPSDANHLYIGTAGGGVFSGQLTVTVNPDPTTPDPFTGLLPKLADVTVDWTPLTANIGLPGTGVIGSLAIDPDDPRFIYAGTGEANFQKDSYPGKGILKSTNGGQTWELLTGVVIDPQTGTVLEDTAFYGYAISKIAVDWTDSNTIFAAVSPAGSMGERSGNCGIYRSLDGGQTWVKLTALDQMFAGSGDLAFTDLIVDPQAENLIFAIGDPAGHALNGVYISPDATNPFVGSVPTGSRTYTNPTFVPANGLASGLGVGRISLASGWRGPYTTDWVSISNPFGNLVQVAQAHNGANGYLPTTGGGPTLAPGAYPWVDITAQLVGNPPGADYSNYMNDLYSNFVPHGGGLSFAAGNYTNAIAVNPTDTNFVALGGGNAFRRVPDPAGGNFNLDVATDILQNYYVLNPISPANMRFAAIPQINSPTVLLGGGPGFPGFPTLGQVPTAAANNQPAIDFDFTRNVGDFTHALAYSKVGDLFVATDTGLWVFNAGWQFGGSTGSSNQAFHFHDNNGRPHSIGVWSNLNGNLPNGQFNSVGLVSGTDDTVLAGGRGIGVAAFADGNSPLLALAPFDPFNPVPPSGPIWINDNPTNFTLGSFDGGNFNSAGRVVVDPRPFPDPFTGTPTFGRNVYAMGTGTLDHGAGVFFYRSLDGGLSWKSADQGLGLSDSRDPILPFIFNAPPATGGNARLLLGTDRLYTSTDPSAVDTSWTVLNFSLPTIFQAASPRAVGDITAIGAGPSNPIVAPALNPSNTIYLGVGSALLSSTDDGVKWDDVTPTDANTTDGAGAPPGTMFTSIVVDQLNPQIVYVVSPNAGSPRAVPAGAPPGTAPFRDRIWLSTNGGQTWTEISAAGPDGSGSIPTGLPSAKQWVSPWSLELVPLEAKVATGGSGYTVGDLLTVDGGAFTVSPAGPERAQLRVTSIAVNQIAIVSGGSGYRVGDVLTVTGGSFTTPMQLTVTAITGTGAAGGIAAVTLSQPGSYSATPPNPVAVTGGGGLGATFSLSGAISGVRVEKQGVYTGLPPNPVSATVTAGAVTGAGARFNLAPEILLVGTDAGIFYTLNPRADTRSWIELGKGMPDVQIRDLEYDPVRDTLAAATYGLGVYQLKLKGGSGQIPAITAPASRTVVQNAAFFDFGNTVNVSDTAVVDNPIEVKLTVQHGTLTLSGTNGLDITSGTNGSETITFRGTVNNIPGLTINNIGAALNGLRYTPTPGYIGPDTLVIEVDDLGNTGGILSTRQTAALTVNLTIVPVTLSTPANPVTITADQALPAIVVNVLDNQGNVATTANLSVTLDIARTATVVNGGTGFTIGDILTVEGGTGAATQLRVASIGLNGSVTGVTVTQTGSAPPANPVSISGGTGTGATFTLASQAPAGYVFTPVTVQAVNGVATFTGVSLTQVGTYQLAAEARQVPAAPTGTITVTAGATAALVFNTTNFPANPTAGAALPDVLVDVVDQHGNLVDTAVATITLSANYTGPGTPAPGTFNAGNTVATTVGGRATFSGLVLRRAGDYTFSATDNTLSTTSGPVVVKPDVNHHIIISDPPPTATFIAGRPVRPAPVVTIFDIFDNVATLAADAVTIAVATGPAGFTTTSITSLPAVNGVATFDNLRLDAAGTYTLSAAIAGTAVIPDLSAPFTVQASAGANLVFETNFTSIPAGVVPTFRVDLFDALGNLSSGSQFVTITATGPGPVTGTTVVSSMNGVATFDAVMLQTPGTYTLTATSGSLTAAVSNAFTVTNGLPSSLAFNLAGFPAAVAAGVPLPPIQVELRDVLGNLASGNATVTLTATGPGTLGGVTTATASGGRATFTGLVLQTPGSYVFTAQSGNLSPALSSAINVVQPAATSLGFTATLADAAAGAPLPDIKVNVLDQLGNPFASAPTQVTLTVNGSGTVPAPLTATTVNGVATFSGVALNTSGSYTLSASAAGLGSATSSPFNVTAGSAVALAFAAAPANAGAGTLPSIAVELRDAFGNLAATSGGIVTLSATGPDTLGGTTQVQTIGGVATFTNVLLTKPGSYTLDAAAPGLSAATSAPFTLGAGAAAQLVFQPLSASIVAGQTLPTFKVDVFDAFGNLVGGNPTVTVASSIGSGITGTTSVQAVNGTATFTGIGLTRAGSYGLVASAGGLTSGTSAAVTVAPAAAAGLAFAPFTTTVAAGEALLNLRVNVVDAFGNIATQSNAQVSLGVSGPGPLGGGATTAPAVNGVATFILLSFTRAGSYTLTASAAGLNPVNSTPLTVTPGTPTRLVWVNLPGSSQAGQTLPMLQVQAFDAFGNLVTDSSMPVTVQASSGNIIGTASAPIVNGFATFTGLALTQAGTVTLTANVGGQASVTTAPFIVMPSAAAAVAQAVPAQVRFLSAPVAARRGRSLGVVRVQLLDSRGRPVRKARVQVRVRLAGGGRIAGTLRVFTDARGIASFTNLRILSTGRFHLIASATGVRRTALRTLRVTLDVPAVTRRR